MAAIVLRAAPARALPSLDQAYPGKAPKPGSALRAVYDLLMANKCRPVSINRLGGAIRQLEDFYGLDIERSGIADGTLVGREVGTLYHDYRAGVVIRARDR